MFSIQSPPDFEKQRLVRTIVSEELGVEEETFLVRRRGSSLRPILAHYLIRYSGLTQREVAPKLKMTTGASVSTQVARFASLVERDGKLTRRVRAIERRLEIERDRAAGAPEE